MRWLKVFECTSCGTVFEDLIEKGEEPIACPKCNGKGMEISPTQTSPTFGKHGSWAEWRRDHDWDKPGK